MNEGETAMDDGERAMWRAVAEVVEQWAPGVAVEAEGAAVAVAVAQMVAGVLVIDVDVAAVEVPQAA